MESTPDLASVLRTLSTFTNPASSSPSADHVAATNNVQQQQQQQQQQPPKPHKRQPAPSSSPSSSSSSFSSSLSTSTDPSQISTWPAALKHIMHLVSSNQSFSTQIQRLIKSQREHEQQWWSGREALIAKQRTREEKKRRLEEVLKSVGAPSPATEVSSSTTTSNKGGSKEAAPSIDSENTAELLAYDSKVYQASVDMARAVETELRRLGVPFFCLSAESTAAASSKEKEKDKEKALSKDEVDALKRRVLDLLVDLCT